MARDPHTLPNLDHFLQAEIISKLAASDTPIRFSDLKEDGIENSLFMYHANKLIDRGLVQKDDAGFTLTPLGAQWANYAGVFHDFKVTTPRPLVQFVVRDSAGNVLLSVRKGQLKKHLNDYLLPGNIYRYDMPLEENMRVILEELFPDGAALIASHLTTADVIHRFNNGMAHHVISFIFNLTLPGVTPQALDHPLFTTEWVTQDSIVASNPRYDKSQFLPVLFARLPAIQPHETFILPA